MKRWVLLIVLIGALAAFYYRQQIYVRDFRASVTRNDVVEDGAQVFFSINNDILLENDNPPMYVMLLQHERPVMVPKQLNCIHYFICYAKGDDGVAGFRDSDSRLVSMTDAGATFLNDDKKTVVVRFR